MKTREQIEREAAELERHYDETQGRLAREREAAATHPIECPAELLPPNVSAASFDPVLLRAAAEAHNRTPFAHNMEVKAWVVLWLLDAAEKGVSGG